VPGEEPEILVQTTTSDKVVAEKSLQQNLNRTMSFVGTLVY